MNKKLYGIGLEKVTKREFARRYKDLINKVFIANNGYAPYPLSVATVFIPNKDNKLNLPLLFRFAAIKKKLSFGIYRTKGDDFLKACIYNGECTHQCNECMAKKIRQYE